MRFTSSTVLVTIFCCTLIIFAYVSFFHSAIQQNIAQLNLEKQQIMKTKDSIIEFKNKYGDLDEYMQEIEERYKLASISLPENLMQGEFINFLQGAAMKNQIKIISLKPQVVQSLEFDSADVSASLSPELIQKLQMLPINLKIECDYVALINFLKSIEMSERLVQIKNFSIGSKDGGEKLMCELYLVIFSMER